MSEIPTAVELLRDTAVSSSAQRDSPAVRALMERIYPDPEVRKTCLQQYADSICTAHAASPQSWALSLRDEGIRFNVGRMLTLDSSLDVLVVVIDREATDVPGWTRLRNEMGLAFAWGGEPFKVIPTAYGITLSSSQVEDMLPTIRPLHLALVQRAATAVRTRTNAFRSHSPAVLAYLEEELGQSLPIPGFSVESTTNLPEMGDLAASEGSEVLDLTQRDDPELFKLITEHLYPDPEIRTTCLRQLVESIRIAHEVSPTSWGISLRKSHPDPKLNVGTIQTLCLRKNRLDVWVDRESASDELWKDIREGLGLTLLWGGGTPRSMTNAFGFSPSGRQIDEALLTLRPLHLALVEKAAARQRRTRFPHFHCPGMVAYLREALDEDIPDPAYAIKSPTIEIANQDAGVSEYRLLEDRTSHPPFVEPTFPEIVARVADEGMRISERTLRRYHLALQTRGFVILSGLSGTGKTWLTEVYARATGARHAVIPIAPNWTTNEDLLGYHNPITGVYHDTAFGRFLREAAEAWQLATAAGQLARPYHVVLDEMNLARVEYYFAKFLSAMEMRARSADAVIEFGPADVVPLTPNLKVIGTVNIDETTHGFADKIYDRAQLIELEASRDDIAAHLSGRDYQGELLQIWDAVHRIGPFTFRVLDEMAAYVDGAAELGVPWPEALDEQILQKVLPKINGADHSVGEGLTQVVALTSEQFPLSHRRAADMLEGFKLHGFASYFR